MCVPRKDSVKTAQNYEIGKSLNILSELVMSMIKSSHQVKHDSHRSNDKACNQMSETPLAVGPGLSLQVHMQERFSTLMFDLDLSISYDKIKIENYIVNSVTHIRERTFHLTLLEAFQFTLQSTIVTSKCNYRRK